MALDQVNSDDYEVGEDGQLKPKNEKEMSFLDHLEELRWHIIYSLIAVVLVAIVVFLSREFVFDILILGPKNQTFPSYVAACNFSNLIGLGDKMCITPVDFEVVVIEMGELFLTHIKVSMVLGLIVSFPFIFWQFWKFIRPGLHQHEQKAVRGVVLICSLLFFTGVSFGYFVISPFAVNFLVGYQIADIAPQVRLSSMVNYMVMFTAPAGLIFELPVVVYFLARVGLLTPEFMRQYRRHAIIGILGLSALITPPDIVTQFLIGIPLYILYEISIGIAARMSKRYQESLMTDLTRDN
ncbi:MAG: sec-independent protein translocase protein TatC [Cognaticolwellia sp.]|jgi:sec-independent protein translocase protein TatC